MTKTLVLCDCMGSQSLDREALSKATGLPCSKVHTELCHAEAAKAAAALEGGEAVILCGQEWRFFEELAEDMGLDAPPCIDVRDRAGWSSDDRPATPKMAALIADGLLPAPLTKTVDVESEGTCLIIGDTDAALKAAEQLQEVLAVTLLSSDGGAEPPADRGYDVIRGRLKRAEGALGGFSLRIDALQRLVPGGRGAWQFEAPRNGAQSECDIILDLSGDTPLFSAHDKREGYLRADPGSSTATAAATIAAAQLVGTFEKPLYVRLESVLCAHSRAGQVGCSRCLDICPTGAISPDGDHVAVDAMVCAGCGACSALCPSGAISYDAPPSEFTIRRVQTLARAYLDAGGPAPRLLAIDRHGSEMIRLAARFGDGLPADVIPIEVDALTGFGHAEMLAALAAGFVNVAILPGPQTDRVPIELEVALTSAIAPGRAEMLDTDDPASLPAALAKLSGDSLPSNPVRPMGTRRQVARQAARALNPEGGTLPLPDGAPYGAVLVNKEACTLCLSCISLCPSGALGDNPDLPQVRFQEDACLQCGLCATICPEDAITLQPRLNLDDSALEQVVLNEEEPFACVECGTLFGSRSTVERITEKLGGHSMYQNETALRMIQMCDNCRVNAQYHAENNPFAQGERPRVRTTDDYLSKRRDH